LDKHRHWSVGYIDFWKKINKSNLRGRHVRHTSVSTLVSFTD
jgi:hypothetical protein